MGDEKEEKKIVSKKMQCNIIQNIAFLFIYLFVTHAKSWNTYFTKMTYKRTLGIILMGNSYFCPVNLFNEMYCYWKGIYLLGEVYRIWKLEDS